MGSEAGAEERFLRGASKNAPGWIRTSDLFDVNGFSWAQMVFSVLQGGMVLILTRKIDESVKIGNDISVMVCAIRGDRVRLGFEAPPSVNITRDEIYSSIKQAHREEFGGASPLVTRCLAEACSVALAKALSNPLNSLDQAEMDMLASALDRYLKHLDGIKQAHEIR